LGAKAKNLQGYKRAGSSEGVSPVQKRDSWRVVESFIRTKTRVGGYGEERDGAPFRERKEGVKEKSVDEKGDTQNGNGTSRR